MRKIRRRLIWFMALTVAAGGPAPVLDSPIYAVTVSTEVMSGDDEGTSPVEFIFRSGEPNSKGYLESAEEEKIYSYVQCPASHYEDKRWVGDWSDLEVGGQTFWGFGCGICCLSNMVNTLTNKKNTPDEMYKWCKKYTDYYPESGYGALSWKQLRKMSKHFQLKAELCDKPDYEFFQADIMSSDTALVLVSSYNDAKLWSDTGGHYVNIWEYDMDTDTVFVTDSSSLNNRCRVALRDVYNALKTSSDYQYMCVSAGK